MAYTKDDLERMKKSLNITDEDIEKVMELERLAELNGDVPADFKRRVELDSEEYSAWVHFLKKTYGNKMDTDELEKKFGLKQEADMFSVNPEQLALNLNAKHEEYYGFSNNKTPEVDLNNVEYSGWIKGLKKIYGNKDQKLDRFTEQFGIGYGKRPGVNFTVDLEHFALGLLGKHNEYALKKLKNNLFNNSK